MLSIGGTTRVFLAVQPVDLRGSFDRLYGYVTEVLREDPRSGQWYGFVNKRRTRIKRFPVVLSATRQRGRPVLWRSW